MTSAQQVLPAPSSVSPRTSPARPGGGRAQPSRPLRIRRGRRRASRCPRLPTWRRTRGGEACRPLPGSWRRGGRCPLQMVPSGRETSPESGPAICLRATSLMKWSFRPASTMPTPTARALRAVRVRGPGVLVSSEALAEFKRTLDMWHQHPQQPNVAFVERARLLAAKRQHRRGLRKRRPCRAIVLAAFMEPGEIGVEFAAERSCFPLQLRAELRVSKVVAARFGNRAGPWLRRGRPRWKCARIGELAAIGRHQEIAWPAGFAKVQQGPFGAENRTDPAADIRASRHLRSRPDRSRPRNQQDPRSLPIVPARRPRLPRFPAVQCVDPDRIGPPPVPMSGRCPVLIPSPVSGDAGDGAESSLLAASALIETGKLRKAAEKRVL